MIIDFGVIAHNILSANHSDTLADTVVRGDLLYGNSTPKWARLPKPSVLSGLSHNGDDVSWVTATGTGAPVRATAPSVTSITLTPTDGTGFIALASQASPPATPVAGQRLYGSTSGLSWIGVNGFTRTFNAGSITANRTWALPDADGTILTTAGSGASLTFPGTLVIASGKTATINNTITFAGTDSTTMAFPTTSATLARTDAANAFIGVSTGTNWNLTTPIITTSATGPLFIGGTTTTSTLTLRSTSGSGTTGADIIFQTGNNGATEAARFLNSGNFGIGTTNPVKKLHIYAANSQIFVDRVANTGGNYALINFATGGTQQWIFGLNSDTDAGADKLGFFNTAATQVMTLSGVNVGIGTSSPSQLLTIKSTGSLGWDNGSGTADTILSRDTANTLAQRNGTTAQTSRIYETYTDASNYSRLSISAPSGGPITFASEAAGTGTARGFQFTGGNITTSGRIDIGTSFTWGSGGGDGLYAYAPSLALTNGTSAFVTDTVISRISAALFQFGKDVNAAATAQTLQAANAITGSNLAGGNLTLRPGAGMGTGTVSALIVQTPTIAASGANTQAQAERARFDSSGLTLAEGSDLLTGTTTGSKIFKLSTHKGAFWGATPVVQPTTGISASTFVANTSLTANDSATWDGYTVGQVVKALRTAGLLA